MRSMAILKEAKIYLFLSLQRKKLSDLIRKLCQKKVSAKFKQALKV